MSDLVVIEFDDEQKAFDMRAALAKMQKEYLIQMKDIVVVTRNEKGKIRLHQAVNLTAAGAIGGTFWGDAHWHDLFQSAFRGGHGGRRRGAGG